MSVMWSFWRGLSKKKKNGEQTVEPQMSETELG